MLRSSYFFAAELSVIHLQCRIYRINQCTAGSPKIHSAALVK